MVGTASYLTGNYLGWTDQKGILNALFLSFANVARVSLGITIDDVRIYGAVPLRILMLLFIAVVVMLFRRCSKPRRPSLAATAPLPENDISTRQPLP